MHRGLRLALGTMLALSLAGCASPPRNACPNGQQKLGTAQLFFGRSSPQGQISDAAFRRFVDEELTPRFPDGLTILDGGGQWRGADNKLIREASKVVLIVLPKSRDAAQRLDQVRSAYKSRFAQEAVLLVMQPACVSF